MYICPQQAQQQYQSQSNIAKPALKMQISTINIMQQIKNHQVKESYEPTINKGLSGGYSTPYHPVSPISAPADKIYQNKKSLYRQYIRQIYHKINQEITKKNNFLSIASQTIRQLDPSDCLTTKQFKRTKEVQSTKPDKSLQFVSLHQTVKDRIGLVIQEKTSYFPRGNKQKIFSIKKQYKGKLSHTEKIVQAKINPKTQRNFNKSSNYGIQIAFDCESQTKRTATNTQKERSTIKHLFKEDATSLNSTFRSRINMRDYMPVGKTLCKAPFVCGMSEKQSNVEKNRQKLLFYIDFLWKINYSNALFIRPPPEDTLFKFYVGFGNNSIMIKSIIKRRSWWTTCQKPEQANFIWTQLKINDIFQNQASSIKSQAYTANSHHQQTMKTTQSNDDSHDRIFNHVDQSIWRHHVEKNWKSENSIEERTYLKRGSLILKKNIRIIDETKSLVVHNHLEQNYYIGNKKALFYYMKSYYQLKGTNVFQDLPLTFHVSKGLEDSQYKSFLTHYASREESKKRGEQEHNIWILKPGEFSNRGNGISVCHSLDDIMLRLKAKEKSSDGKPRTFIIQKYIEKPLLYKSRKFDIRHYLLMTCCNGTVKAYWFPQGYVRTSSSLFSLKKNTNLNIHLTNDAIQKKSDEYGKYEKGNKISYEKFQSYLDKTLKNKKQKGVFYDRILPEMKRITANAVKSTYLSLDPKRKQNNFELFGMDFMIDQHLKPWLIEINTNPCLELSSPLLARLIPTVLQQAFRIALDPLFPPPNDLSLGKKTFFGDNILEENSYELIFDECIDGFQVEKLLKGNDMSWLIGKIQQDAQIFQDDGQEEWQANNQNPA